MTQESIPLKLNEKIKPIEDYEGLYSITSFGRVWSHRRFKGTRWYGGYFLKFSLHKKNYLQITLCKESKRISFLVHILVAKHYLSNPNNLPQINHKDTNKQNNCKDNLEWCTNQENREHAVKNNLIYKRSSKFRGVHYHKNLKRSNKKWIVGIKINNKTIHIGSFKTEIEAAIAYNNYVIKFNIERPLNEIPFFYNFPEITIKISERKQIEKIQEEFIEFLTAKNETEKYREWSDFLNCIETYMRTQMDKNKLLKARDFVIEKNKNRGYYSGKINVNNKE